MLEVRGLRAGYGSVEILRGIDLDVRAGEIVAVLGSNGVGKSTLNNNLSALYRPFAGSIRFQGEELVGCSSSEIVRRGLIHVPEGRRIFPNLNVRENLELGSLVRGKPNRARNLEHVVGIFPRLKERFGQLAGLSAIKQGGLAWTKVMQPIHDVEGSEAYRVDTHRRNVGQSRSESGVNPHCPRFLGLVAVHGIVRDF